MKLSFKRKNLIILSDKILFVNIFFIVFLCFLIWLWVSLCGFLGPMFAMGWNEKGVKNLPVRRLNVYNTLLSLILHLFLNLSSELKAFS